MSNKTSKKSKKKKYSTRIEKNKNIYYKNDISVDKKDNKKQLLVLILVVSIVLNSVLLLVINNKNNSINKLNDNLESEKNNYKEEIESIKDNYTNYLFLGDSITEYYDLDKYFPDMPVVNSGVAGDTTDDILNDMKGRVYDYNPSKVFLLIGTNDLLENKTNEEIVDNIKRIVEEIRNQKSAVSLYLESIYPINRNTDKKLYMVGKRQNSDIIEINGMLEAFCKDSGIEYINTYDKLLDGDGNLDKQYTKDGLHLSEKGYAVVTDVLSQYLENN